MGKRGVLAASVIALAWCNCWCPVARADVPRGFAALQRMEPRAALGELTPAFVAAMRTGDRRRAANVLMLIGHAFGLDANYSSYLDCAKLARALDPNSPTAVAFELQALLRLSRNAEAAVLAKQYESQAPQSSYLARSLSDCYRACGSAATAIKYLELAQKLNPNDPVIYAVHARQVSTTPEDSAHYFELAASHSEPGSYRQQANLFNAERARLKDKASSEWLDASSRDYPNEPNWMANKALWLVGKARIEEAAALYERAVNSRSRISMRAWMQFSTFCAFNKRPNSALALAAHAIEIAPELPDAYLAKGHALRTLGMNSEADAAYKLALSLNPHFSAAYEALRDSPAYRAGDKYDWLVRKWVANCPEKTDAWLLFAESLRARKDWREALRAYSEAHEHFTKVMPKASEKNTLTWCRILAGQGTCSYKLHDIANATVAARSFNGKRPPMNDALIRVRPSNIDFASLNANSAQLDSAEHAALADMLYECGELSDCVTEYKRAIALWNNPEWHRGLLKAYMDKHDYAHAAEEDVVVANQTVMKDLPAMVDKAKKLVGL